MDNFGRWGDLSALQRLFFLFALFSCFNENLYDLSALKHNINLQTMATYRRAVKRRPTATPIRRRSRRGLSAGFSMAKVKKGVNVSIQGAIGGALAGIADTQIPPLVGLQAGSGYGALIAAVLTSAFTGRDNMAAGMAGVAGARIAGSLGLADLADEYGSNISSLGQSKAKQLLQAGGGLSANGSSMGRRVMPNYSTQQ